MERIYSLASQLVSVTVFMNRSLRLRKFSNRKDGDLSDNLQRIDTNWNSIPMGITVMNQLLICSSNGRDFNIDNIKKEHVPLMKHPESFRKTLVQIANDCYGTLVLAHKNMENIQLQMGQLPCLVEESIEIFQSTNNCCDKILVYCGLRHSKKQNLLINLENIKKIADNGLKWSTEVSRAFNKFGQLNQQAILAITARHGEAAREQEIEKAKNAKRNEIQRQLEDARKEVQRKKHQLVEAHQFGVGDVFGLLLLGIPYAVRIDNARIVLNRAEQRLQHIQEEKDKISEFPIDVDKEVSRIQMIVLLKQGMSHLGQLNSIWAGFTQNFNSINNYIEQATQRALTDFVEDAKSVQEDASMIDFMTDSITKSLECSKKTHNTAKMYVEFSNNQIMKSLNEMQRCKNALPSC